MKFAVPSRRRALLAIGAGATALVLGAVIPAVASTTNVAAPTHTVGNLAPIGSPQNPDHQMGASIRQHLGAQPMVLAPNVTQTPGLDVSHYQGTINWTTVHNEGAKFAYIKATEGTSYHDPEFNSNYPNAYYAGLIRGAYHFGRPDVSGGAAQADYFVSHGGGWSKDGKTLPGALDIEWGSSGEGGDCYGKSQSTMVSWILAFSNEYHAKTTRWPVIYTATSWWSECTGNRGDFSSTNPLWVARYSSTVGTLPYHWGYQTIWQYADAGTFPGDQDRFNGDITRVQALANG